MAREMPKQVQDHQPGSEAEMRPAPEFMPRYGGADRLKDKTAFVTGGDSGIGRAIAVLFAREGARVAIHHKEEDEDAEETLRLIEKEGAQGLITKGDLGDREVARHSVRKVTERFGAINVLVNNAAEQHSQDSLEDISAEQLQRMFATNVFAQFYVTQSIVPSMEKGDAIINVTSITAFRGSEELIDYSATKGAVLSFTRALAAKLVDQGVRVNAIAPGPIWTPLIPASFDADRVAKHGQSSPMKRAGQPNEVAPCALFLACEDSSYMTGQTLHPNGGSPVGS